MITDYKDLSEGLTKQCSFDYYNERERYFKERGKFSWKEHEVEEYSTRPYKQRLQKILKALALKPGDRILEIAFNDGKTMFWTAEYCPGIIIDGIDAFEPAFNFVNGVKDEVKEINKLVLGNAAELSKYFEEGSYDFVFCIDVIEHLDESIYFPMIKEIHKMLKKDGTAVVFGGQTPQEEHIHILSPTTIAKDFISNDFRIDNVIIVYPNEIFQFFKKG